MLWGYFSSAGTGALFKIEGIMDSSRYQSLLAQNLQASVRELKMKKHFTFQHDNDPKHKSKSTKKWLQKNKINAQPGSRLYNSGCVEPERFVAALPWLRANSAASCAASGYVHQALGRK
ncbi:hypothetical protein PDJAM_G00056540 [Pangasius djambal]|uniref:Uncharacterized protein n=1 Tax=Pangasius djambal TaxID=1691987 RepID=A0ACC5YX11_9TELE|nr:hypothetical protein [Pangasius djambal]